MSSLRERLAAKARRTTTVPVQVSDPGPAPGALAEAEKRLQFLELVDAATTDGDKDTDQAAAIAAAREARDAARAAVDEHYEDVTFAALDPADMEAFQSAHTNGDGDLDDVAGVPVLAAACAVDVELRDEDWWREQLDHVWSYGERASLWSALLELNFAAPAANPKG